MTSGEVGSFAALMWSYFVIDDIQDNWGLCKFFLSLYFPYLLYEILNFNHKEEWISQSHGVRVTRMKGGTLPFSPRDPWGGVGSALSGTWSCAERMREADGSRGERLVLWSLSAWGWSCPFCLRWWSRVSSGSLSFRKFLTSVLFLLFFPLVLPHFSLR